MERLNTLRDAFVQKTLAAGFTCPIAPPTIVLIEVASYGNYDPATNQLQTPAWQQLQPEERDFFLHLAGPGADEKAAQDFFESGTHRWVFIHEMGHWWQKCIASNAGRTPYQVEYDANRIAAAYWREIDPSLMVTLDGAFHHVLESSNPVPAGQSPEAYFNANYDKLGLSPDYGWFQARMVTSVNAEKPAPSFAQSLAKPHN